MRSKKIKRLAMVSLFVLAATITFGFLLSNQQEKDFKLTKNLDMYSSRFSELNTFYVEEIDP